MLDLSIIILNYATPQLAIDCLATVIPQAQQYDARIVVVDNNSPDNSAAIITDWIAQEQLGSWVELVAVAENGGFSSGINHGIACHAAENYLLLNSDILLRENALELMLDLLRNDSSIGLVGPRFETPAEGQQSHTFRNYTPVSELLQNVGSLPWMERFARHTLFRRPFPKIPDNVSWTEFACVLIRRSVFESTGLMDDGYFLYFEDVDFCLQARRQGWRVVVHPDASVVHFSGSSTKLNFLTNARRPRYYYASRTRYYYKCFGFFYLTYANICWTVGWIFSQIRRSAIFHANPSLPKRGIQDIWTNYLHPSKRPTTSRHKSPQELTVFSGDTPPDVTG